VTITTYAALGPAVSEWMARNGDTDIATRIDDLIALHEQRMYYGAKEVPGFLPEFQPLRIREMETTDSSFSIAANPNQPTGFLELIEAAQNDPYGPMDIVTESLFAARRSTSMDQTPTIAVSGSKFLMTGSGTATLKYFAKLTTPSVSNSTNSILTTYPGVYLNGCLLQAAIYTGDPDAAKMYAGLYVSEVGGLNERRNGELAKAANVRVRIRGSTP
jgi:hypothetical protein